MIDALATVGPEEDDRLATVLEHLHARRDVDLVVAVLGRVAPDTVHTLAVLGATSAIAVLTQPAALMPSPSLVVVDASIASFAEAWNDTLARASSRRARTVVTGAPWSATPGS